MSNDQPSSGERWLPIPRFEGSYEVSDLGNVRSVDRQIAHSRHTCMSLKGRLLKPHRSPKTGYLAVTLYDGVHRQSLHLVHRLVLLAHVGPCPEGMEACHADAVRTNNRLSNLRWDTKSANARDSIKHGNHPTARRTHCPRNHPYDDVNTYWTPSGWRQCRTCNAARDLGRVR